MLHIGGLIAALAISVLFTLFLNGDVGWALIYTIGGTAVISAVLFLVSRRHISIKLSELSGTEKCGRRVEFEIVLRKTGFCIMPFIELCVDAGEESLPIRIRTSLIFGKTKRAAGSFRAERSGLHKITLSRALIYDLVGVMRGKIELSQTVQKGVLPKEIEYDGPEVLPSVLPSDNEETEEGAAVKRGGMPGYEHREYVAGDSPRRVNYKLSAKRNKLMVRLDESQGTRATNIFLANNAQSVCADKAFALARRLIMRGGTVKITHKGAEITAATPETLERMREWLAFREFAGTGAVTEPADSAFPEGTSMVFSGDGVITQISAD